MAWPCNATNYGADMNYPHNIVASYHISLALSQLVKTGRLTQQDTESKLTKRTDRYISNILARKENKGLVS